MKTLLILSFLRCMSLLPLKLSRILGSVIGGIFAWLPSGMKTTVRTNLKVCFPELEAKKRETLVRQSIRETFKTVFEMGSVWIWPEEKLLKTVHEVEGAEILQKAFEQNKGVVVIAPHMGNWEIVGPYLNKCGYGRLNVMYQAQKEPALDKLVYSARSRVGMKLAATDTRGVAKLLAAIRKGELVGILPDQVPHLAGGEYAKFFGHEALTMTLLSRLMIRTEARAVLAYAVRTNGEKGAGFKVIIKEPDEKVYAKHMQESLQGLNDTVEAAARDFPADYQWEYKRFKYQPDGQPSIYG